MILYCICAITCLSSVTDSTDIVPAFRDSILSGNIPAAVELISIEAVLEVDSVLEHNPAQIAAILSYFNLQIDLRNMGNVDGKQLLSEILSNPAVSGAILLFGISPEDPFTYNERLFVPVGYGLFGERDTMHLELISEEGQWRIRDFFEILPE